MDCMAHFYGFYGAISMDSTARLPSRADKNRPFYGFYDALSMDSTAHFLWIL